jgi:hypothetical protein
MEMLGVLFPTSKLLEKAEYGEASQTLNLFFLGSAKKAGAVWQYVGVPRTVFEALATAESAGKYYHREIKGKFVGHNLNE